MKTRTTFPQYPTWRTLTALTQNGNIHGNIHDNISLPDLQGWPTEPLSITLAVTQSLTYSRKGRIFFAVLTIFWLKTFWPHSFGHHFLVVKKICSHIFITFFSIRNVFFVIFFFFNFFPSKIFSRVFLQFLLQFL